MKRCVSLTLVFLLLFNSMGFYGILLALRYQNEQLILSNLDTHAYDEGQTQLIKLPLHLPYAVEQFDYERVNGEFHHNGVHYRLVKQKLANDTLFVVCIEDHQTRKYDKALADYAKTFADGKGTRHVDGKITSSFGKDYIAGTALSVTSCTGWSQDMPVATFRACMESDFTAVINHPPQLV